jgi:uncharacterized protein GlcG (DUF336 family)
VLFSTENKLPMPCLLTQRNLSLDLALEAATVTLETARSRGYHVGVAVTDRSGQLLVLLRDNGGGAHLLDGARRKAFKTGRLYCRKRWMPAAASQIRIWCFWKTG